MVEPPRPVPLSVFDLDKTLIKIDSLQFLVTRQLFWRTLPLMALRALGIHGRESFAAAVTLRCEKLMTSETQLEAFLQRIRCEIDPAVGAMLVEHRKQGEVVIASASPEVYVSRFAKSMGAIGIGSHFDQQGNFFHCYGDNKVAYLTRRFPKSDFLWNFAISDSESDLPLLRECKTHQLWRGPSPR